MSRDWPREPTAFDLLKLEYQHHAEAKFDGPLNWDQAIALHEAAHALVAFALGVPVKSVRINDEGGGGVTLTGDSQPDWDGPSADRQVSAAGVVFFKRMGHELPPGLSSKDDFDHYGDEDGFLPPTLHTELVELLDRREIRRAIFMIAAELLSRRALSGDQVQSIARVCGVRPADVRADARRALAEIRLTVGYVDKDEDRVWATFKTEDAGVLRLGKAGPGGWHCDCDQDPERGLCVHLVALQMITAMGALGVER